jgi:putative ABC transport system permease protein
MAYDHPLEANWSNTYTLVGAVTRGDDDSTGQAELRIVSPSYFNTLGVELLEGRTFADQETFKTRGVAVVNELLARSIGGDVLSRVVRSSPPRFMWGAVVPEEFEIVGVVENERFRGLEQPFLPALYLSTRQFPQQSVSLLVRTSGQATGISSDLRASVRSVEPLATVGVPRALTGILHEQLASRRVTTGITGGLAGSALVLAALGIYGLLAAAVATRTREIGVRLAVGASPALVATHIVRECLSTAGLGVAAGIAIALGTGRVLESLLVGVSARDPSTFALVALTLLSVSLCAGLIPAMRAARIDPVITLRLE